MNSNALNIEADINMHKIASEGKYRNIWPKQTCIRNLEPKVQMANSFEDMIEKVQMDWQIALILVMEFHKLLMKF